MVVSPVIVVFEKVVCVGTYTNPFVKPDRSLAVVAPGVLFCRDSIQPAMSNTTTMPPASDTSGCTFIHSTKGSCFGIGYLPVVFTTVGAFAFTGLRAPGLTVCTVFTLIGLLCNVG